MQFLLLIMSGQSCALRLPVKQISLVLFGTNDIHEIRPIPCNFLLNDRFSCQRIVIHKLELRGHVELF